MQMDYISMRHTLRHHWKSLPIKPGLELQCKALVHLLTLCSLGKQRSTKCIDFLSTLLTGCQYDGLLEQAVCQVKRLISVLPSRRESFLSKGWILESPIGFQGSCGAKEQTGDTREWEEEEMKNILSREKNSESLAHTHLAVLLKRIMGFRCYSGAADVRLHRQRPKARYQLNTDTPHHGFRDYRGWAVPFLTQSAVLQTLTPLFLFIYFPLIYSCLLCSLFLPSGTEEKEPSVCVCLLGQVNIWNDRRWRWLECWRRCLRAEVKDH